MSPQQEDSAESVNRVWKEKSVAPSKCYVEKVVHFPTFPYGDSLTYGSANLRINRASGGSSEADLTCGWLYSCGFALVPALLRGKEDAVFLPGFQASQDIGSGVSWKFHLHWLAWVQAVVEAVMVKLGRRPPPEQGQVGLCGFRNPQVLGCVYVWEESREMNRPQAGRQGCSWGWKAALG